MEAVRPPEAVQQAQDRLQSFHRHLLVALLFLSAMFLLGMGAEELWGLGAGGVLGSLAMGLLPFGVVIANTRDIGTDQQVVAMWEQKKIERIVEPPGEKAIVEDARWASVAPLLARLRELTEDHEVIDGAEAHLRHLLKDLRLLDGAVQIEAAFEADERSERLRLAVERAESEWRGALGVLRDLHLELSMHTDGHAMEQLTDLVHQAVATSEVELSRRVTPATSKRRV